MDAANQTQRLRMLVAVYWVLGFSYRGIETLFSAFRVDISRMGAWQMPVILGLWRAYVRGLSGWQPALAGYTAGRE